MAGNLPLATRYVKYNIAKGMTAKAISQALNCHESNASVHLRSLERLGRVRQVNKTTPYHFVLGTKPSKGEGQPAAPPTKEQALNLGEDPREH